MESLQIGSTLGLKHTLLLRPAYLLGIVAIVLFLSASSVQAEQSVNLAWDPSPSAGVAGYTVRYGTSSGNYSDFLVVGLNTTATVPDLVESTTYYFVVTAYTLSGLESDPSNELVYIVPDGTQTSNPPTLDVLSNMTIPEDASPQTVALTGITVGLGGVLQQLGLSVTATSGNLALIPNPIVTYSSPNSAGMLLFTPAANASGTATITVTVNNFQQLSNSFSRSFNVTVNPINDPPTIDDLSHRTLATNAGPQTVPLTGITSGAGNESQTLTVTAISSNPGIIPHPTVSYISPGSTGSLTFTPLAQASGTVVITVTVNDGQSQNNSVTKTFNVTVGSASISTIFLEAENGSLVSPMSTANNASASGGQFVHTSTAEGGTLSVPFNIAQAGDYVVWCRVLSPDADSDSFYVSMDAGIADTYFTASNSWSSVWQWSPLNGVNLGNPRVFTLGAGSHTLLFRGRESNTYLDALYITNDRSFVPSDTNSNQRPTLNAISDLTITEDAGPQTLNLAGITSGSANENQTLTVTATSSNPGLISNPIVSYASPNPTGTLTFTPAPNASGSAIITLTVNDGQPANNVLSNAFTVTVTAMNDAPTLNALSSMSLDPEAGRQTVALFGISSGAANESQALTVSATSDNPELILNTSVNYSSPNTAGMLSFTPAANAVGTATITVTVNDGQAENNITTRSFEVTINPVVSSPLTFYLEAEAAALTNPIIVAASTNASSGGYVYSPFNEKGTITFNFNAVESGDYVIWCRILSVNDSTDSFYVSVDGQSEDVYRTAENIWSPNWQWSRINSESSPNNALTFPLSAGSHTLRLRARESVTLLDAVYITKSPNFVPIKLSVARLTGPSRGVQLSFQSVAGYRYAIETSEDMHSWTTRWSSQIVTSSQTLGYQDTASTPSGKRFYRVRVNQ